MLTRSYRSESTTIGEQAPAPVAKGRTDRPVDARMNKTEAAYSRLLDARIITGEVLRYWFEAVNIRIADSTHHRTDFLVQLADGTLEIHEVKGRKGDSFYATEDAWLKIKTVAELFPFRVFVVWPAGNGSWNRRAL